MITIIMDHLMDVLPLNVSFFILDHLLFTDCECQTDEWEFWQSITVQLCISRL